MRGELYTTLFDWGTSTPRTPTRKVSNVEVKKRREEKREVAFMCVCKGRLKTAPQLRWLVTLLSWICQHIWGVAVPFSQTDQDRTGQPSVSPLFWQLGSSLLATLWEIRRHVILNSSISPTKAPPWSLATLEDIVLTSLNCFPQTQGRW